MTTTIPYNGDVFARFSHHFQTYLPLVLIVVIAASLRWFNLNWDNGFHLHPDERFLTMVQLDLVIPSTLGQYLDPAVSSLNPQNRGHDFYVYGTFPLTINKLLSVASHTDTYDLANLQGRFLSGLADVGTVILVYSLAQLIVTAGKKISDQEQQLKVRWVGIWAAGLYAVAVLPIQLSHFFTVDSFLVFFATASLWASWRYALNSNWRHLTQAGVFFGLALGCKLTALFMTPLLGVILVTAALVHHGKWQLSWSGRTVGKIAVAIGWWLAVTYCALRLASPNYFATTSWLDPQLNPLFVKNLTELRSFEGDQSWYPPAIQWINKPPVWFSLKNLAVYGVGLPWFGLAVMGVSIVGWRSWRGWKNRQLSVTDWGWLLLVGWIVGFFLYQSVQFAKVMRYFNLLYPGLALLAGLGLHWLIQRTQRWFSPNSSLISSCLVGGIITLVLLWPAAFMSIYLQLHSRVTASIWLNQNVADGSRILSEYWDDPLPLLLPRATKTFSGEQIGVFDQDTPVKWTQLNQSFATADYYVLSSNRAWGSIMPLPGKYPQMAAYYQRLLAGQTDWQLVQTVTNYPSLRYLGLPIDFNTDEADEAFTVYDHPKVLIFGKPHHAQSKLISQPLFETK